MVSCSTSLQRHHFRARCQENHVGLNTQASQRFEYIIKTEGSIKVKAFDKRGRSSHIVEIEPKPN